VVIESFTQEMTTMGRAILNLFLAILIVGAVAAIGGGIYQAGVAQGIVEAGRVPAGAAVGVGYGYGYGWGFHGFGFLGLLFPLFFLFLLFGLARAAFGRGRGWVGGWGRGYGRGFGPGDGPGRGFGPGAGPDAWREERDRRVADLHRRLHEEEAAGAGGSGAGGSTGPSGTGANPA
jgi:hypothetical protein